MGGAVSTQRETPLRRWLPRRRRTIPTLEEGSALPLGTGVSSLPDIPIRQSGEGAQRPKRAWSLSHKRTVLTVGSIASALKAKTGIPEGHNESTDWDYTGKISKIGLGNTRGRFCDVYEGLILPQRTQVAVKILRAIDKRNPRAVSPDSRNQVMQRLGAEMKLWTTVSHPRIVPILGYALVDQMPSILSEWCAGGDLDAHLQRNPHCDKAALVLQVAEGLVYLHGREPPVPHGGIHAENILIGNDGKARLCDFAVTQVLEEEFGKYSSIDELPGPVRYSAPELLGGGRYTLEADVYSFGCLALAIMSGKPPFVGIHNNLAVMRAKAVGDTPTSSEYPAIPQQDARWNIMEDCWNGDPAKRPTMTEVYQRLWELESLSDG